MKNTSLKEPTYSRFKLQNAVLTNNHQELQRQLKFISPNFFNKFGNTPLILAAKYGNIEAVRILLHDNRVSVNSKNNNDKTALLQASRYGHSKVVNMLLRSKQMINPNIQDSHGNTALILAAKYRHKIIIDQLLAHKRTNTNLKNNKNNTALIYSAKYNCTEIAESLLNDSRTNFLFNRNENDQNALCFAINNSNKDMMHALLEKDNVCHLKEHDIASFEASKLLLFCTQFEKTTGFAANLGNVCGMPIDPAPVQRRRY